MEKGHCNFIVKQTLRGVFKKKNNDHIPPFPFVQVITAFVWIVLGRGNCFAKSLWVALVLDFQFLS